MTHRIIGLDEERSVAAEPASGSSAGGIGLRGLTPMLDALFILLFALLALSDARTSTPKEEVRVELPRVEPDAGVADVSDAGERVAILIEADATLRVLGPSGAEESSGSVADLDALLAPYLADRLPEEFVIEIQADRSVPYGAAIEVLQAVRNRGLTQVQLIALAHEPVDAGEAEGPGSDEARGSNPEERR